MSLARMLAKQFNRRRTVMRHAEAALCIWKESVMESFKYSVEPLTSSGLSMVCLRWRHLVNAYEVTAAGAVDVTA